MKKKLLTKLCAVSVLGCTLLATTPVFANTTYLKEVVHGGRSTSLVYLGSGTRYFCGTVHTLTTGECYAYKDVDWSPDIKVATITPNGDGGYDEASFTAEDGQNYYGHFGCISAARATLSFTDY